MKRVTLLHTNVTSQGGKMLTLFFPPHKILKIKVQGKKPRTFKYNEKNKQPQTTYYCNTL